MMTIKEFSLKTNFSTRMLRYLEEIKLLVPSREQNNYRSYQQSQVEQAFIIKRLQKLGFYFKEIKQLELVTINEQAAIISSVLEREQDIAEMI